MNGQNAAGAVVGSVVIIVGSTIVRHIRRGTWRGKIVETIIFGYLLAIALLILSIAVPVVAKVLAYLGIVGAFVVNGPDIFALMGNFGTDPKSAPKPRVTS